jgi:hypothetical protein
MDAVVVVMVDAAGQELKVPSKKRIRGHREIRCDPGKDHPFPLNQSEIHLPHSQCSATERKYHTIVTWNVSKPPRARSPSE